MNALTDTGFTKLVNLLKANLGTNTPKQPRFYTDIAQGVYKRGRPITYYWSHGWTRNLNHNSMICACCLDGHKNEFTLNNKLGGYDGQIKYFRTPKKE